jgi:[ribosomal protein S18]-alanine N-acetyltransferase
MYKTKSADMGLRDLSLDDLKNVSSLDRLCFPPEIAFSEELFSICLQAQACECFGDDLEDGLKYFAILYFSGPLSMQILTIDVHPDYRRQGYGDKIMAEIERRVKYYDVKRLVLQVGTDNLAAISLYEKWGFHNKTKINDYYGEGLDAYLMDKLFD